MRNWQPQSIGGKMTEKRVAMSGPARAMILRKKQEKYIKYLHRYLLQQHMRSAPKMPRADNPITTA